jgi:ribosome-binding protein aMBF1 (putative translation factor)
MDKHFKTLDDKQTTLGHQDWNNVVLHKKTDTPLCKPISQEQQRDIKLLKKVENDELKHDKITIEIRTTIQQYRASQKWTQKDLANRCNLPVTVINEIESGKAIYNAQHINKIKRVLKIK